MKFEEGQKVRLLFDVVSDGTVLGIGRGKLVVPLGSEGFVTRIDLFKDDYVYEVDFLELGRKVGCRDYELIDAEHYWKPPKFGKKDSVETAANITREGSIIIPEGTGGRVLTLDYHDELGYIYEAEFENGERVMVAEVQIRQRDSSDEESSGDALSSEEP